MRSGTRDPDLYGDDARMAAIMAGRGTWAVVGLSPNRRRAAYGVAQFLMDRGVRVVPVHPSGSGVHGQPGFRSLAEARAAVGRIDVVDVFVRSELAGAIVDEAIEVGARAAWLQLEVIDEAAAARARAAGLLTVMDQCPAQQWDRLVGPATAPTGADGADQADESAQSCAWAPPPDVP